MTIPFDPCSEGGTRGSGPFVLVLFGATGDLTRRKLIPAFYSLFCQGLLGDSFAVIAFARRPGDDTTFRDAVRKSLKEFAPDLPTKGPAWDEFSQRLYYHHAELSDSSGYRTLKSKLIEVEKKYGIPSNRLFYLATPPDHFAVVTEFLGQAGLQHPFSSQGPWSRIIVEKPFGYDLETAQKLNRVLRGVFAEEQIYRIDHYLGKETVQNILVMRFGNKLFELLWNQSVIDNVQITVAETLGMEGRGAYFDAAGITRDIVQNHALQILTLIAMEPPVSLSADAIRDEKVKVLQSMRPFSARDVLTQTVRGQYTAGRIPAKDDAEVIGYLSEEGVAADSLTDTYSAIRFHVDNWRWFGVPFYVRAGKRLAARATEINIQLKAIPDVLFAKMQCSSVEPNRLTLRIQPDEGIVLHMTSKSPGPSIRVAPVNMRFEYAEEFKQPIPEAYERLILDAVLGEASLFARADEVEAAWDLIAPVLGTWRALPEKPQLYPAGSWGPESADALLEADGRRWHNPAL